jgi:hypothetical protein
MKKWMIFNGNNAYIMELGKMTLLEYLNKYADNLTDYQITNMAKDIALAMVDFHRGTLWWLEIVC